MLEVRFNQPLTLDPRGRLALPARLKNRLEAERQRSLVFIVYGGHLRAYTHPDFTARVEAPLLQLDSFDPEQELRQRRILGYATELDIDDAGRVVIPANLREMAGLERDVVAISLADRLELWDAKRFADWWAKAEGGRG